MEYQGETRFQVGDIVILNESWILSRLSDRFRGQVIGYSKGTGDMYGNPCVRIKRLDLPSGAVQIWGQGWLKKEARP